MATRTIALGILSKRLDYFEGQGTEMGSELLLKKEQEYHELNEKLELRARELLKEVNSVMVSGGYQPHERDSQHFFKKFQDHFLISSDSTKVYDQVKRTADDVSIKKQVQNTKTAPLPTKNGVLLLNSTECKQLNIPEDVNNMGAKALVHFLKANMKKLQGDNDKMLVDYKSKSEEFQRVCKENKKLTEEKEKWVLNVQNGKNHIAKLENQVAVLQSKLQTKEGEATTFRKVVDQLEKELKSAKLSAANIEVKYNRALEECENTRSSLKSAKKDEKELRDSSRKQINELTGVLKRIEKHKTELLNGFKKQLLLIDNLKRQKAHIECYKLAEKGENDFMKILDWKAEDIRE